MSRNIQIEENCRRHVVINFNKFRRKLDEEINFKASFEESLNLEDDGFLQYQKQDYYNKLGKAFKKGRPSFWFGIKTFILSLCFDRFKFHVPCFYPIIDNSDPKDLRLPVSQYPC